MLILTPDTVSIVGTVIAAGNAVVDKELYSAFAPSTINECFTKRLLHRDGVLIHATHIGAEAFKLSMMEPDTHKGHA